MKKYYILFIILFICIFIPEVSISQKNKNNRVKLKIVIKKFKNSSEYRGRWNIGLKFPELLKKELKFKGCTNIIIENNIYSDIKYTNAIVITGDIKKFKFREHIIAAYKVGGYKNYNVTIEILLKSKYSKKTFTSYISKKNIGIALFGGPGRTDDFEKNPYKELQKISFGGNRFRRTIYGAAVKDSIDKMVKWIDKIIKHK